MIKQKIFLHLLTFFIFFVGIFFLTTQKASACFQTSDCACDSQCTLFQCVQSAGGPGQTCDFSDGLGCVAGWYFTNSNHDFVQVNNTCGFINPGNVCPGSLRQPQVLGCSYSCGSSCETPFYHGGFDSCGTGNYCSQDSFCNCVQWCDSLPANKQPFCALLGHSCPSGYEVASYAGCGDGGGNCCVLQPLCTNGTTSCGGYDLCQNAPANTCYAGNGVHYRTCYHDTLSNGSTACRLNSFTQAGSCTTDNCYNNYTCSGGNCVTHITVHIAIDYGHDGSNDAAYPYGTVYINGGNAQVTGADGSVTYSGLTTGTYTISYNDSSVDYQQTGATSQNVTLTNGSGNVNVYFRVTPLYRVSGNLFNDNNHNKNYDGGDTLFTQGTTTVHVSGGPTAVADMTQTDGTYTTPESLWSGTYTFTQTHTLPTGYTYTTPTSWTVTVGNVGAPGPHCSVGTSPDGVCGNPNNGSISNLNFGINPPYQISGTVFNDANKDQNYNNPPDSPFTQKPSIRITGPSNMSVAADGSGNYTTGQVLPPGTYTVAYNTALPTSYTFTTPSTWAVTVGYNPACNKGASPDASCGNPNVGSINNLNFGVTNENPWHQEVCLDVRNDSGTYQDQIPPAPSCGGVSGAYNTITNGTCSTGAGIVFTCNATGNFGFGSANVNNWTAGGTTAQTQECYNNAGLNVIRTSYEYLETTARQSNITPINMNNVAVCGAGGIANCTLAGGLAKGIYQANGTVNLNAYVFPAPSNPSTQAYSYIFLINGDLHINGNILIPKGSVAVFSTSGSIYVDKSVGQVVTNSTDPSVNNPNIEGLYSADGNFIIQSYGVNGNFCNANGTPLDKKLNVIGSIVTNASKTGTGGLINNRDLCIFDYDCSSASVGDGTGTSGSGASGVSGATGPGTVINYLLTLLSDGQFLNHKIFNWQELRP